MKKRLEMGLERISKSGSVEALLHRELAGSDHVFQNKNRALNSSYFNALQLSVEESQEGDLEQV